MIQTTIEVQRAAWWLGSLQSRQKTATGVRRDPRQEQSEKTLKNVDFLVCKNVWAFQKDSLIFLGKKFPAAGRPGTQNRHVARNSCQEGQAAALPAQQGRRRRQASAQAKITSWYGCVSIHVVCQTSCSPRLTPSLVSLYFALQSFSQNRHPTSMTYLHRCTRATYVSELAFFMSIKW